MSHSTDQAYLLTQQYQNASNLNARIALHERFTRSEETWPRWVFDRLELGPEARLLEVGSGPGMLWRENLERIPAGWDIVLADFSPGMIETARQHLSHQPFQFVWADVQALPDPAATFEAVIANHMLYHVPDRPKALSEIRRVLKPGGHLYAATNGPDHMRELRELGSRLTGSTGDLNTLGFNLENGTEQLEPFFTNVRLERYESSLEVTEVEPLVAYLTSGQTFSEEQLAELQELIEQQITSNGAFHITKETGLFVAERPAD